MIVGDIQELKVVAVLDRGVANDECIVIRVDERVDLGQFGIMLGFQFPSKMARPYLDYLFWFGDGFVNQGDWIFIYTGAGEARTSASMDKQHNLFSVFWGRGSTVFANTNIVPILFRVDAVDIPNQPENVPQLGR